MGDKITVTRTFECDEKMIPIVKELWDKGYTTSGCCEGHLFLEEFAVGGDETVDDEWETNCEVEEGYVEFDSSITITSVPNGWTLCDRSDIEDTQTIYFEYPVIKSLKDIKVKDSENVKNQFAQERTSGMNSLLKWVNELPKLN